MPEPRSRVHAAAQYDHANSKEDFQKMVAELKEAIRLDPSFAHAWAAPSITLSTLSGFHFIEPTKGFEEARSAALKAIELEPEEQHGHRALAKILYLHDWDWDRAELEIKQALRFGPDDPGILVAASVIEGILGRANVALQYSTRAVAKDPLSSVRIDCISGANLIVGA
jgi:tetratricopeptide (TPR) repeat protein